MAEAARHDFEESGAAAEWIDLADIELPFCDGKTAYGHENAISVSNTIAAAQGVLVATPVYNYDVNAALKNLIELTGRHWTGKIVGFACAAGGQGSYMSVMAIAASLMLDFRCVIVPRFVYATGNHFEGPEIADIDLRRRITALTNNIIEYTKALDGLTEPPPER